jgi:hypothetical protein
MALATDADRTYKKAGDLLNTGNLTGAEELAREAKAQFISLGDTVGKANAEDLITRIVAAQSKNEGTKSDADSYYNKAFEAFKLNDMADALSNAKIARAKYLQINDAENVNRCDEIIKTAKESVAQQAADTFGKAQNSLSNKQFNDAVSYANKSVGLFELLSDAENKQKSLTLLAEAQNAGGVNINVSSETKSLFPQLDSGTQTLLLFGGVGLVLLIIIVYLASVVRKRRKVPHLKLVLADDSKESILDELDKDEKAKGRKRHKKEEKSEAKVEEKKKLDSWIDVRNVEHEKREVFEHKEDPNHKKAPLSDLKQRKRLEKITKDGFQGLGVSLANLGVKRTAEMKKAEEEDISD